MGNIRGKRTGEAEAGEVEGSDVAAKIASNPKPRTVGGGGVPGGEGGFGVGGNGGSEVEKGLVFGNSSGEGMVNVELEETEEEEETHF